MIGLVVVHWAFLEYALFLRTVRMAQRAKLVVPKHALSFSFSRRLRAFRTVAERAIKRKEARAKIANLISDNQIYRLNYPRFPFLEWRISSESKWSRFSLSGERFYVF